MGRRRTIDVQFPAGGLNKRFAYQQQPPFTTHSAANARPEGVLEGKVRGGSRPALVKSFQQQIGGASVPIRMLTVMRSLASEGRATFTETFDSALGATDWEAPNWSTGLADGLPSVSGGLGRIATTESRGAILKDGGDAGGELLSETARYSVECYWAVDSLTYADVPTLINLVVFAKLEDVVTRDMGVRAVVQFTLLNNVTYNALLFVYVDGTLVQQEPILSSGHTRLVWGTLRLAIENDIATADWIGFSKTTGGVLQAIEKQISVDVSASVSTGKRVGFECSNVYEVDAGETQVDNFVLRYIATSAGLPPEAVIASGNGELWRKSTEGTMVEVANYNSLNLASDRPVQAVDYLGKLYIADSSDTRIKDDDGDGVITNGRLDDANVTDWTDHGILQGNDVVELTAITGGAGVFSGETVAVYAVSLTAGAIHAGNGVLLRPLDSDTDLGAADDCTTCKYRIARGAKVYDADTDTLTHWKATTGLTPVGCPIIEIFGERLVLGGDPENYGVWFMSRFRDPLDFNYGASKTDRNRAVASNSANSDTGGLGLPLSAIAALTEDYLMFSAESELYLLRGDPTAGGILGNISRQIGIGSRTASCHVPDGSLVFLSRDGLYRFHPSQPFPENISRDKLPLDLIDVVQNTDNVVTLEYDIRFQGVHIYVTPTTAGPTSHYWFDWTTQSFWLTSFGDTDHEPFAIVYDAKANHVLLGCRDGYIRHYDSAATDDDGTDIVSHVLIGPIRLGGNPTREGMLRALEVVLDDLSADVTVEILAGDYPETAQGSEPKVSYTASAGFNGRHRPRVRGACFYIRLSTTSGRWMFERLTAAIEDLAMHRT